MSVRLRISGLGHNVEIDVTKVTTLGQVKENVSERTDIPAPYILLLSRGKKLLDGEATLEDLGILDRTRLMLMHGPGWHTDRAGVEEIQSVSKSLDELEAKNDIEPKVVDELVTQACIRLDHVDVGQSETLRELRRSLLRRAEDLAAKHKA